MKCPICAEEKTLQPYTLADGLEAAKCKRCEGIWVSSLSYFTWLKTQNSPLPERAFVDEHLPLVETSRAMLCPDCGRFMRRYKVFPEIEFYLDHCSACNGVWFDKHEWDALVACNLHDKVNQFFTKPWQHRIQEEETRRILQRVYTEKLGESDYARLKEVRAWLDEHPLRSMLLAYLESPDPYKL